MEFKHVMPDFVIEDLNKSRNKRGSVYDHKFELVARKESIDWVKERDLKPSIMVKFLDRGETVVESRNCAICGKPLTMEQLKCSEQPRC